VPRLLERANERRKTRAAIRRDRRLPIRSRVARLRSAHSYRTVLLFIIATFLFAELAGDASWTTSVLLLLQSGTLAAAMWTSGLARADSKLLLAQLALGIALAIAAPLSGGNSFLGAAGIVSGVLAIATIGVIAVGVIDQAEVNAQSVTGAICIYLLLGILFMFFYSAVALIESGDFFAQATDGTRSVRLYFSYVTLVTLGYGDYTAAAQPARSFAIAESLLGQLYLVTVVALLVGRIRAPAREPTG